MEYVLNITKVNPNGIIVNATSSSFDYFPILGPVIGAIIGAGIAGIIAWLVSRSQRRLQEITAEYQRRQLQLTSILEAFKILNSNRHRHARESVYCAYHLYTKGDIEIFQREPYHTTAAMVRADMDQMGLLVNEGLIDKDTFLKVYWHTVLATWKSLEEDIKRERKERDYDYYMTYFSKLNDSARKYRDDNKLGTGEIRVYTKDDCNEKFSKENIDND